MVTSGLVDKVDVSHYRLSLHLFLAFLILSLLFWEYLKLINLVFPLKKNKFLLSNFFFIINFSSNYFWCICIGYGRRIDL